VSPVYGIAPAGTSGPVSRDEVAAEPHDHIVNFYDEEHHLVDDVCFFLSAGLAQAESALVVATADHRDSFAHHLQRTVDFQAASDAGRYVCFDAAETLSTFMVDGRPDPSKFAETIGGLIAELASAGRPVRVYGEMVALLWADGDVVGAIELERLWNELSRQHTFVLYCAYPVEVLTGAGDLVGIHEVCGHHSTVVAPRTHRPATARGSGSEFDGEAVELYIPVPSALRAVRCFVKDALTAWGKPAAIGDASLVVSELATNAIVHANSPFRVSMTATDTGVKIAVDDLSPHPPILCAPEAAPTGGRGVMLVAALSSRWGVELGPHGKRIWSEIAC
jgi:MEDS: MEthanogen/methylotroph, DcmR Sensory domain/Histidine kinase-like ATPase domain